MPAPTLHEKLLRIWETPPGLFGVFGTVDHKKIGMRYLVTAFVFLAARWTRGGGDARATRATRPAPAHAGGVQPVVQHARPHDDLSLRPPILSGFTNYIWPLIWARGTWRFRG